ncbi:DoxX family protein [Halomonas binhaiensis]|uniref:DoxX family protein n=1 Tax=Halomonas binhaiensis TaxID=2562282 RepID=A0A5C1NH78_9GAMM|nr:DoxX family protein [Halomonas binhaiensis]QEM82584.1 DoxX family protein [Halomonas binhaiensis]
MSVSGVKSSTENAVALRPSSQGTFHNLAVKHSQKPDGETEGVADAKEFRDLAEENDWKVLEEGDVLPPVSQLDPERQNATTITYEYDGTTYAVSSYIAPFKYSVLGSKIAGTEISHVDNNVKIDVADSEATDFMNAETSEDGKTVGELFHDKMKDEWGDLDLDDPRRQYYELLQAKTALVGGFDYLPYQTEKDAFPWDGDTTGYLKNSTIMDQASTYGLLKEKEINDKLAELSEDEQVIDGIDGFMQDAVSKIKDKKGLTNRIYEAMSSPEYMEMLEGMNSDAAKVRFSNDLKSLDYLDSEKASEIRNNALDQGLAEEISNIIESGDYAGESLELAISDHVQTALQGTWSAIFGLSFSDRAVQNYLKNGGGDLPDDVKKGLDSYKAAVKVATDAVTDSFKSNGKFDIHDVSKKISAALQEGHEGAPKSVQVRNGAAALLHASMTSGALPAIAGTLTATAAIYTLTKNQGDTVEERMAAARALMITLATSPAMATVVLKTIFNQPGMVTKLGLDAGSNTQLREAYLKLFPKADDAVSVPSQSSSLETQEQYRAAIGGDLPQVGGIVEEGWADDIIRSFDDIGSGTNVDFEPQSRNAEISFQEVMEEPNDRLSRASSVFTINWDMLEEMDPERRAAMMSTVDQRFEGMGIDPSSMDTPSKLRLVGTMLHTVGGLADVAGGVLDLALGAMSIDKLIGNPDALDSEFAAASLQLLGGISIAGAAGTNLASMIAGGSLATGLGIASGALGIAGVALGGIAAIVMGVVAKQKSDQKAEEVLNTFENWSALGITEDDWGDKLNYTIHSRYEYDQEYGSDAYYDLYPEDKPVWESRPEQYEDFTDYVADHKNISDDWFSDWDDEHDSGIGENGPDPSGRQRFGDDGDPGSFGEFKKDVDRVDVGSIELADNGRVFFTKDGVKQVIDPFIGEEASDSTRQNIIDYLTQLYEISHPDGKKDHDIIDEITSLHDKSDKYNEIDDLKRALDDSQPPLFGVDDDKPGTFDNFKMDIDRVDVGSIELDPSDSSVITFVKDGKKWQLDKDNHGDLKDYHAEDIFDYLKDLHILTHPDDKLDEDLVDKITQLHDKSDDYNDIEDLRDELDLDIDPTGLPVFGDGGKPGSFGEFKKDVDRVDVESIKLLDDGRVIFVKDGVKQIINPSQGDTASREVRDDIVEYLEGLYDITHPEGKFSQERADLMNEVFGRTDDYNSLDDIRSYVESEEKLSGFGKEFIEKNRDYIDTIVESWDDWNGGDSIVSMDNLEDISQDDDRSKAEQEAAQFLIDEWKFFETLDTAKHKDDADGKISTNDLDSWLASVDEGGFDEYSRS